MNSPLRISATQTGMTLIELIITVAIVAILVGISVPSFAHLGSSQKMTTTTHLVVASFNQARMRAISTGRQVVVCPSTDGISCRADSSWNAGWIIYDDVNRNERRIAYHNAPTGITSTSDLAHVAGRASAAADPTRDQETITAYDTAGRISRVTEESTGRYEEYGYDGAGNARQ